MGYNSNFEIEKYRDDEWEKMTDAETEKLSSLIEYEVENGFIQDVKWYSIIDDMKKFSSLYPDFKWVVYQEGEDRDDYVKYIFKNGKYKTLEAEVKIIYPIEEEVAWAE